MLYERLSSLTELVEPDRVHRHVYTDAQIFELEMERIHQRLHAPAQIRACLVHHRFDVEHRAHERVKVVCD